MPIAAGKAAFVGPEPGAVRGIDLVIDLDLPAIIAVHLRFRCDCVEHRIGVIRRGKVCLDETLDHRRNAARRNDGARKRRSGVGGRIVDISRDDGF